MRSSAPLLFALLLASAVRPLAFLLAAETEAAAPGVWDAGRSSAEPLTAAALAAKTGWTEIPKGTPAADFKGDAVLSNGRLLAVLRKQSAAVELYALGPAGALLRSRLVLVAPGGDTAARLVKASLAENTKSGL